MYPLLLLKTLIKGEGGIFFSRINKRGGSNKSVEGGKISRKNKWACPFIRKVRVYVVKKNNR